VKEIYWWSLDFVLVPDKGSVVPDRFVKEKLTPIRLRIFNVIKIWIEDHFYDIEDCESRAKGIEDFISSCIAVDFESHAKKLQEILKRRVKIHSFLFFFSPVSACRTKEGNTAI